VEVVKYQINMKVYNKWICSIPDYPLDIKVSDKKRTIYYKQGDKIPKKYLTLNYVFNKEKILIEKSTSKKVIKNTKTAGNPRFLTINAQKIYVGVHHSVRSKIVNELHKLFNREFKKQFPAKIDLKDHKILIGLHFYDAYHNKLPDLDNLAQLYAKCGIDCLTVANNPNQIKKGDYSHKLGIIPDDKLIFIPHIFYDYTNVESKDRKLDFVVCLVDKNFSIENLLIINPDETA